MGLRLMDDDFMTVCLENNIEAVELIAKTFIMRSDIKIIEVNTQKELKNLHGRSAILDIYARDTKGNAINIEFQKGNEGLTPQKARYYNGLVDTYLIEPGEEMKGLPETYTVCIFEKADQRYMQGKPIQIFDRYAIMDDGIIPLNDGTYIIYVDCSYKGDDDVGRLIYDILCPNPTKMNNKILAETTARFKFKEEGVRRMCAIFEEIKQEGYDVAKKEFQNATINNSKKIAMNLIKAGDLPLEKIAKSTGISIAELEELKAECDKQKN